MGSRPSLQYASRPRAASRTALTAWRKTARRTLLYGLLAAVVIVMTFPLVWMSLSSLKTEGENYRYPPAILPRPMTVENYRALFNTTSFPVWFRNSLLVSVTVTVLAIAFSATGAYALARFRYSSFEYFARLVLFAYMIPSILLVVPIFRVIVGLRLANTLGALIAVHTAILLPYGLWTLRSYFAGIPREIEESALIDGATRWRAFASVILPQALPGIISVALFAFHVSWNEFLFASTLLWSSANQTLSAGVATLIGSTAVYSWGMLMAAGVMVVLPVVFFFSILQRFLIAGWGGGAVKG